MDKEELSSTEKEFAEKIKERKKVASQTGITLAVIILGTVIICVLCYLLKITDITHIFYIFIGGLILFMIVAVYDSICDTKFKNEYKNTVLLEILKDKFQNVSLNCDYGIEEKVVQPNKMFGFYDIYRSNDYIKGTYNNINFETSDVYVAKEIKKSIGNNTYTEIEDLFKGQWFIFDFPKPFKEEVLVYEKSLDHLRFNDKTIEVEDIEFNESFNVYSEKELEVFYILTPHVIQQIKTLSNQIPGSILLRFVDNKLHIGVNSSKDLFELEISTNTNIQQVKDKTLEELTLITEFIETLNLDNTLFK